MNTKNFKSMYWNISDKKKTYYLTFSKKFILGEAREIHVSPFGPNWFVYSTDGWSYSNPQFGYKSLKEAKKAAKKLLIKLQKEKKNE